jgi:hypothetical protein
VVVRLSGECSLVTGHGVITKITKATKIRKITKTRAFDRVCASKTSV